MFSAYGLRRASIKYVARKAGLSRPTLYQHFRNKDDLVEACFDLVTEDGFGLSLAAAEGQNDRVERVTAYLCVYMSYYHRLLFSGPHSDDVLELKCRFGPDKVAQVREVLSTQLNELAGLADDGETGPILPMRAKG
ncbi:MAG: TetR/AcrR family transcriptional regulator [Rhodobacteraceae bacterium]|nr:TetR/AcrR family transcriptional regulator [Paracoccaceae bacterium]